MTCLARLRWVGAAGILVASGAAWRLDLPSAASLVILGLAVLLYNARILFWLRSARNAGSSVGLPRLMIHGQIALDLLVLASLAYRTGGSSSPFVALGILYMLVPATLLQRRDAYLPAIISIMLATIVIVTGKDEWAGAARESFRIWDGGHPFWRLAGLAVAQIGLVYGVRAIMRGLRTKEERLNRVQGDLSEAYRRLEEMDSARARFVLTLTHELRSPVAAIDSLLKVLPYAGELPPKARDLADRANQRVDALMRLVNDLLEVAKERHEYGSEKKQPVDLGKILRTTCAACKDRAEAKSIALELETGGEEASLVGDPEELDRLFLNLIGNAVSYTPEGGKVRVRLDLVRDPAPGEAVVTIRDNGIGIPKDCLHRLFEEFYRAPNAKKVATHGTGLGLTISKRIVKAHGGRIDVESEENVGSTFAVRLPLHSESGGNPPES